MDGLARGVFIAGTDTGVGKTIVSAIAAILLKRRFGRVAVFKPVATGGVRRDGVLVSEDALFLRAAIGSAMPLAAVNPQCFEVPLAPPLAAAKEGRSVDWSAIEAGWKALAGSVPVVVEGVGGLFSPVAEGMTNLDLARMTGLPVWVVVPARLGMIHQAVATIGAAKAHGIRPAAFVVNGVSAEHPDWRWDEGEIARATGVPCAGRVPRIRADLLAKPETLSTHPDMQTWLDV